jgi:hypothetical protein
MNPVDRALAWATGLTAAFGGLAFVALWIVRPLAALMLQSINH